MGFDLTPAHGDDVRINGWNWRPTLELLRFNHVISDQKAEEMGWQCCGIQVDAHDAERIAAFLDRYLEHLDPQARVFLDGTTTTEPDTFEFYRDDLAKNYSATAQWLRRFRDFCRTSGGFGIS